jgi:hypothetical protein
VCGDVISSHTPSNAFATPYSDLGDILAHYVIKSLLIVEPTIRQKFINNPLCAFVASLNVRSSLDGLFQSEFQPP